MSLNADLNLIHNMFMLRVFARPVARKKARENANATAALDKEWNKLRNMSCWGETGVE